jgi:hypothetical protein
MTSRLWTAPHTTAPVDLHLSCPKELPAARRLYRLRFLLVLAVTVLLWGIPKTGIATSITFNEPEFALPNFAELDNVPPVSGLSFIDGTYLVVDLRFNQDRLGVTNSLGAPDEPEPHLLGFVFAPNAANRVVLDVLNIREQATVGVIALWKLSNGKTGWHFFHSLPLTDPSRGRITIDPACLRAAPNELECAVTGSGPSDSIETLELSGIPTQQGVDCITFSFVPPGSIPPTPVCPVVTPPRPPPGGVGF